jgi:hypothetical protein
MAIAAWIVLEAMTRTMEGTDKSIWKPAEKTLVIDPKLALPKPTDDA